MRPLSRTLFSLISYLGMKMTQLQENSQRQCLPVGAYATVDRYEILYHLKVSIMFEYAYIASRSFISDKESLQTLVSLSYIL